nr:reverse transcriptase domain-containing protein [Tanacetum cinerariifolium]
MTPEAIEELVNRHVEEALVVYEATRAANALETENQSQNGSDGKNRNDKNRNDENGNGENKNGGNGNPNENNRDSRPVNSHKRTVGTDDAFAMSWRKLIKLMAEVYCPRNEVQKMESKLWNLTMKNNDLAAYTQRFQELTMLCTRMVPEEEDPGEFTEPGFDLIDSKMGRVVVLAFTLDAIDDLEINVKVSWKGASGRDLPYRTKGVMWSFGDQVGSLRLKHESSIQMEDFLTNLGSYPLAQ